MGGFFGRLARKWWLMLVIGIVIGLGIGLPAGGRLMPGELAGTAAEVRQITAFRGHQFQITFSNNWGQREIGWTLASYDANYVLVDGEYPGRGEYVFYARWLGTTSIFFKMGSSLREYRVTIVDPPPPPRPPTDR